MNNSNNACSLRSSRGPGKQGKGFTKTAKRNVAAAANLLEELSKVGKVVHTLLPEVTGKGLGEYPPGVDKHMPGTGGVIDQCKLETGDHNDVGVASHLNNYIW